jgi:hypothetical protein
VVDRISEGRLHTRKIGGWILISREELLRFRRHDGDEPMALSDPVLLDAGNEKALWKRAALKP